MMQPEPKPSFNLEKSHRGAPRLTVCVVGLGYIGLPTAAVLADRGHQVIGVDVRAEVVETVRRGEIHIHEPHLDRLVQRVVRQGRLTADLQPQPADVFILCVPTPVSADRGPDMTYVRAAARSIKPQLRAGNLVILESTSPPGATGEIVVAEAVPAELVVGQDVFVAHCPERVLPGRILIEVVENDRIVGGVTPACAHHAAQFYRAFVHGEVIETSAFSAEIAKLAENAFRDVNIAFANELSMLADQLGADAREIIRLANRHPRVNILNPGPGVGGHCISVDPWFLVHAAAEQTPLIRTARQVNDRKPHFVVDQVQRLVEQGGVSSIGCLGLAYKADVDDVRESPSLEIVRELRRRGLGELLVCDPLVPPQRVPELTLLELDEVLRRSDLLVLLTDHAPFRQLPASALRDKQILDTRGAWHDTLRADPTPDAAPPATIRLRKCA